jgi:hypothetical protein
MNPEAEALSDPICSGCDEPMVDSMDSEGYYCPECSTPCNCEACRYDV